MADTQPADLAFIREINERTVLNLIRDEGPISRAELARRSNLSRSTVSSIIATLLASNVVREIGIGDSRGGRRPILLEFNYQSSFVVGVEIGTTALTVLLTDLGATVMQRATRSLDITSGPETCIPQVINSIRAIINAAGIAHQRIIGIGVGVPAPMAHTAGRLVAPPAMPGWHNLPLRSLLEETLGLPVFIENDANLAALAEQRWGAGQNWRNLVYVYLSSTGIGAGIIIDHQLYRGEIGSAGEIGHLMVDEHGPVCSCGARGCLEAVAGAPALLQRARSLGLICKDVHGLVAMAQHGSTNAPAIIKEAGKFLGIGIASVLNMINPGCIVLGGKLVAAGDLLFDPLRSTLRERGLPVAVDHVRVVPTTLGDEVVAIGAVSIVVQYAFRTPTLVRSIDNAETVKTCAA